jgi:hypothetical protein
MAERRPFLRERLGVGRSIHGDARIGRILEQGALKALPEWQVSTSMMRRPLLVSMADCSASQLTTVLLSQHLPSALAPAAATDHSLAIGGEGVGVVGVAGILSPLDGGDRRAVLHIEQIEITELPVRPACGQSRCLIGARDRSLPLNAE